MRTRVRRPQHGRDATPSHHDVAPCQTRERHCHEPLAHIVRRPPWDHVPGDGCAQLQLVEIINRAGSRSTGACEAVTSSQRGRRGHHPLCPRPRGRHGRQQRPDHAPAAAGRAVFSGNVPRSDGTIGDAAAKAMRQGYLVANQAAYGRAKARANAKAALVAGETRPDAGPRQLNWRRWPYAAGTG